MWIRKCRAELEGDDAGGSGQAGPPRGSIPESQLPVPEQQSQQQQQHIEPGTATAISGLPQGTLGVPKFQYYQTNEKITVSILEKVSARC